MMKPFKLTTLISLLLALTLMSGLGWTPSSASQPASEDPPPTPFEAPDEMPASPFDEPRSLGSREVISVAPSPIGGPDNYGYTYITLPDEWVNITGTRVEVGNTDVGVSGPIPLNFNFKFYENTYSQLYVAVNGIITFGEPNQGLATSHLPYDTLPNNLIAPFWDDLVLANGDIYVAPLGSATNRSFVIEWRDVTRYDASEKLTFQVVLHENGNITLSYKSISGNLTNCTIGIEDGDGLDGLLYLRNEAGLTGGATVRFIRPGAAPRVKIMAQYMSEFATGGQATYRIRIRNAGEAGTDTFNLAASGTTWPVSLFRSNGVTPLTDTNGDGKIDTGPVAQGATTEIVALLQPPPGSPDGTTTLFNLTATSSKAPYPNASVVLHSTVPSAFAQAFVDTELALGIDLVSAGKRKTLIVDKWFSGSTLALEKLSTGGFMYAWEKNALNPYSKPFTDVEYAVLNSQGSVERLRVKLTDHREEGGNTKGIFSQHPAIAGTSNGLAGVAWIRNITDYSINKSNSNVYMAILDASGNLLIPEINITKNTVWSSKGEPDKPTYKSPRIAATSDNRFVVSWVEYRLISGAYTSDIFYTIYDANGASLLSEPKKLTNSLAGSTGFDDPTVVGLSGNRALLAYSGYLQTGEDQYQYSISYAILNSSGMIHKNPVKISNAAGWRPDVAQLTTGKVVIAWTSSTSNNPAFAVLNGSTYEVQVPAKNLVNAYTRPADYVSVTYDTNGRAVITWMDAEWNTYLYYALVDGAGNIPTQPLIFYYGTGDDSTVLTSFAGQGNTFYAYPYALFLPLTRR